MNLQAEQLERYLAWVKQDGGVEPPVQIDTVLLPHQQARIRWVKEHVTGTILECGCNWGYLLAWVGGHAGVDINPRLIDLARSLARNREFIVGDIRALPYGNKSFDTVVLSECLEHIPWEDVPTALGEAVRVARRKVLVTIPTWDTNRQDSENFKHQWVLTPDRVSAIRAIFETAVPLLSNVSKGGGPDLFHCLEVRL